MVDGFSQTNFYFLLTPQARKKTQHVYVINLAASETVANGFLLARDVINLLRLYDGKGKGGKSIKNEQI